MPDRESHSNTRLLVKFVQLARCHFNKPVSRSQSIQMVLRLSTTGIQFNWAGKCGFTGATSNWNIKRKRGLPALLSRKKLFVYFLALTATLECQLTFAHPDNICDGYFSTRSNASAQCKVSNPDIPPAHSDCSYVGSGCVPGVCPPYTSRSVGYESPPGSQHAYRFHYCESSTKCRSGYTTTGNGQCIADDQTNLDKNQGNSQCNISASNALGNPVNVATGNKFQVETDFQFGRTNLAFKRYYNSTNNLQSPFGVGWTAEFFQHLVINANEAILHYPDGKITVFWCPDTPGPCNSEGDIRDQLARTPNGYKLETTSDATELYGVSGYLKKIIDVAGNTYTLAYSPGKLETVTANSGDSLAFTYDVNDRVDAITDGASGRIWRYEYDAAGNLEKVKYPDGTALDDTDNPTRIYHYENNDFPNALTGITNEQDDRYSTNIYDNTTGEALESYLGTPWTAGADRVGRVHITFNGDGTRDVVNSRGYASTYGTTIQVGVSLATNITGPGCSGCGAGNTINNYDPANNNLLSKNVNGIATEYGNHNANGNPGYIIEAKGTAGERRTDYTYDSRFFNKIETIIEPSVNTGSSKITTYSYDAFGNRRSESVEGYAPDGQGGWNSIVQETSWKYGGTNSTDCPESEVPFHQLCEIDGPRTDVTDITRFRYWPFDPQAQSHGPNDGRLKEVEDASGHLIRHNIQYTATGKVKSEQDANHVATGYFYYPGNDRLELMTVLGANTVKTTRWTYLATGEVETITTGNDIAGNPTPDSVTVTFEYDEARRLTDISDGLGNALHYTLDTEGNVEEEVTCAPSASPCDTNNTAMKRLLTQTFDAYNRLSFSKAGIDPNNNPLETVEPFHDPDGTLDYSTDGEGAVTDYSYDELKRLLGSTHDFGTVGDLTDDVTTAYRYDAAGRLTEVKARIQETPTQEDATTTYIYDDLGNLLTTTSPDTGTTAYTYDAAGNIKTKTTAAGGQSEEMTLNYIYDALNRLTGVTTPDPQENITYTYDNCPNGIGRVCTVSNGHSTLGYIYDGFGNVTAHQGVDYTYDLANRVKTATYLSGAQLTYHYDAAGQVSLVELTVNSQTQGLATNINYAPFGGIETLTYGNGQGLTQVWDSAYRLTSQQTTDSSIVSLTYPVYDGNGNLRQREDSTGGPAVLSDFGYDALNRLDAADGPFSNSVSWSYGYDKNGNRTRTYEGSTVDLDYEPGSNRLKEIGLGANNVLLDIAGNTLGKGNWTYSYTPHYRLKDAGNGSGLVASFAYNGLGQRVKKNSTTSYARRFFYGQNGELLAETDVNGYPLVEYLYLNGELLAIYHPDADGNGQTNLAEAVAGTLPPAPDADGDGLSDADELLVHGTSPANPDTDGDGVDDGAEILAGTNPLDAASFILQGDINLDGRVDVGDYLLLTRYLTGIKTPTAAELDAADMNRNGGVDAGDAVLLLRTVMSLAWNSLTDSALGQALISAWKGLIDTAEAAVTKGKLFYVHNDHLGTPQVMTDENANIVWKAVYDPFGKATITVNTVELNVRFPGQYYDQETGLHYNYLIVTTILVLVSYLTSDPIGLRGSLNTFVYVDSDPINAIDPSGLVKLHGSWCGPDWTGGFRKSYNELDTAERRAALPPVDALDQCCQTHDVTYASCRESFPCNPDKRSQCFQEADRRLSGCSAGTSSGSRQLILMIIDPANGGNPNRAIEDYMRDSIPANEDNAENCGCKGN